MELDGIRVKLLDQTNTKTREMEQIMDFNLSSLADAYEMTVRLIFCPCWPQNKSTPPCRSVDLVRAAHTVHAQRPGGPLVIVDSHGGTEAATFAAFSFLLRQLDYENYVDVYQCAKAIHRRRPGVWNSQERNSPNAIS
jgi:hypothetical protein